MKTYKPEQIDTSSEVDLFDKQDIFEAVGGDIAGGVYKWVKGDDYSSMSDEHYLIIVQHYNKDDHAILLYNRSENNLEQADPSMWDNTDRFARLDNATVIFDIR